MRRAQVVLSLVLLIGGLVLLMSLTVSFLARSRVGSAYGTLPATRAKHAALSGIYDGFLIVTRNATIGSMEYSITSNNAPVSVSISANTPSGFATIAASSTVLSRHANMTAVVTTPPDANVRLISLIETQ